MRSPSPETAHDDPTPRLDARPHELAPLAEGVAIEASATRAPAPNQRQVLEKAAPAAKPAPAADPTVKPVYPKAPPGEFITEEVLDEFDRQARVATIANVHRGGGFKLGPGSGPP
jgi:hypothetical protein